MVNTVIIFGGEYYHLYYRQFTKIVMHAVRKLALYIHYAGLALPLITMVTDDARLNFDWTKNATPLNANCFLCFINDLWSFVVLH